MKRFTGLIFIALIILAGIHLASITRSVGENRVLLIIAPGFDPYMDVNWTKTLKGVIEGGTIIDIIDNAPYNSIYHQLLLLNNTWMINKYLPLSNNTVLLPNRTRTSSYNVLNHTFITDLWGGNVTMLINTPVIDPNKYNLAVNPYYEEEKNTIPPTIFKLRLGGNTTWNLLDTTISLSKTAGGYRLKITEYVDIVVSNATLTTPSLFLNITRSDLRINPGKYYLIFRILSIRNNTVVLFTPGTRNIDGWSQIITKYEDSIIPDLPAEYMIYMDKEDVKWLFEVVSSYYTTMLDKVLTGRKNTILHIVYYPVIEETLRYILRYNITGDNATNILNEAVKGLSAIIEKARSTIGGNITVMIYSPYTIHEVKKNIKLNGLEEIDHGIYRVKVENLSRNIIDELSPFKLLEFNNEKLLISYNKAVTGYGEGYLVLFKPGIRRYSGLILKPENIASYIASLIYGYGIGQYELLQSLSEKTDEITKLKDQLNDKEATINRLNKQIEQLNLQIGNLTAKNENLTMKINELQDQMKEAENLKNQALEYLTVGVASILVFTAFLYMIIRSGVKKTVKGRRR